MIEFSLCRSIDQAGVPLTINIVRLDNERGCSHEVVDERGTSTVWDGSFRGPHRMRTDDLPFLATSAILLSTPTRRRRKAGQRDATRLARRTDLLCSEKTDVPRLLLLSCWTPEAALPCEVHFSNFPPCQHTSDVIGLADGQSNDC
ncbi:hypothetical protein DM806_01890 [Sphingobium lactosutens]|nr:hypothetical protein [Sphingobium lactosutens]